MKNIIGVEKEISILNQTKEVKKTNMYEFFFFLEITTRFIWFFSKIYKKSQIKY